MSWKEQIENIGPNTRLEIPEYTIYTENQKEFEEGGMIKDLWDKMFPYVEQHVWSIYRLFELVRNIPKESPNILEIGSGRGGSLISMKLAKPNAKFWVVDPFQPYDETSASGTFKGYPGFKYEKFLENITPFKVNPTVIRKESQKALDSLKGGKFDLIFVDGNHSYEPAKEDMIKYQALLADKGVFCGHDYHPRFPGVIQAAKEVFGNEGYDVLDKSSIWVMK